MKILISIFCLLTLCAMVALAITPIRTRYEKESDIRAEFTNLYQGKQDKSFSVIESTPRYQDMDEFNPVIFSSGTKKFLIRVGTEIYKVQMEKN